MKRPLGFTFLAFIMGWLALAGVANGILMLSATGRELGYGTPLLAVAAFGYGITAGTAMVGLWRMKAWALGAFLSWLAAVILLFVAMAFTPPWSEGPWWQLPMSILVIGGILSLPALYIRRKLKMLTSNA